MTNLPHHDEDNHVVTCLLCKKEHEGFSHDQAYDCAADWKPETRSITGHYGSTLIDMQRWVVSEDTEMPERPGQVCDCCIQGLMDAGAITRTYPSAE